MQGPDDHELAKIVKEIVSLFREALRVTRK